MVLLISFLTSQMFCHFSFIGFLWASCSQWYHCRWLISISFIQGAGVLVKFFWTNGACLSIWLQMVRCRNGVFLCFFILLMFVEMWSINFLPLIFTFGSITWQGNSYVLRSICSYISQAAEQDVASKFASPVSIMELSQVLLKEDSTA